LQRLLFLDGERNLSEPGYEEKAVRREDNDGVGIMTDLKGDIMKTVQIALEEDLVATVDKVAKRLRTTRSAFTRDALRSALANIRVKELERKHRERYLRKPVKKGSSASGRTANLGRVMKRGEVRWCKFAKPDKRRPVVILTRDSALEFLGEVTFAPTISTIRRNLRDRR
jgi:hypothetical protein